MSRLAPITSPDQNPEGYGAFVPASQPVREDEGTDPNESQPEVQPAGSPGVDGNPQGISEASTPMNEAQTVEMCRNLVIQSVYVRRNRWPQFNERIDDALRLYMGDHWDHQPAGAPGFTLNYAQNVCLFVLSLLAGVPLHPRLRAAGSKPGKRYALTTEGMAYAMQLSGRGQVTPGADGSLLTEDQFQQICQLGMPPAGVAEVTVEGARQALQDCIDAQWEKASADVSVNAFMLNAIIIGFSGMYFRRVEETHGFELVEVHPKRLYPDPGNQLEQQFDHHVADLLLWEDRAVRWWPQFEATLRRNATSGMIPYAQLGIEGQDWGFTDMIAWRQRNVVVRVAYLRHQKYTDQRGRVRYDGIREILISGDQRLADRLCEHQDIPLVWNVCRLVSLQPWGQGYCHLIGDLNKCLDMLVTILKVHIGYYQKPNETVPQSVRELLKSDEDADEFSSLAGQRVVMPDDLYEKFHGEGVHFQNPPPLPESVFEFTQWIAEQLKELAGHVDVMSGTETPDAKSGIAIESLQSAAKGIFAKLAENSEQAVKRIGLLVLGGFTSGWVPLEDCQEILSAVDPQVMRAYYQMWQTTRWVVDVESMAGTLVARKRKEQESRMDYQQGLATLVETLEALGRPDPDSSAAAIIKEKQGQQAGPVGQ